LNQRGDPILITIDKNLNPIDMIYNGTEDNHLKAVVNAVSYTISFVDTIDELRGLIEGKQPE